MQVCKKLSIIKTFCFHWRQQYYGLWICILDRSKSLKLKTSWWICFLQTWSFSVHTTLTDGLEWCGLLVIYCDVFISLDSHSDGTHSLQRIHWWASDEMLNFPKSVQSSSKNALWVCLCGYLVSGWISSKVWDVLPLLLSSDKPLENVTKQFVPKKKSQIL